MKSVIALAASALFALAIAPAALAQRGGMDVPEHATRPVVMELFSSQGCGNCPVANANIAKLARQDANQPIDLNHEPEEQGRLGHYHPDRCHHGPSRLERRKRRVAQQRRARPPRRRRPGLALIRRRRPHGRARQDLA